MEPAPIQTAPRDGTLFDMVRRGIRYTDCSCGSGGLVSREHGYPSVTTVFLDVDDATWTPRPDGLIDPYQVNEHGEKYVP